MPLLAGYPSSRFLASSIPEPELVFTLALLSIAGLFRIKRENVFYCSGFVSNTMQHFNSFAELKMTTKMKKI